MTGPGGFTIEAATALAVRPSPSMLPDPVGSRKARAFDGTGLGSQITCMGYIEKSLGGGERIIAKAHFHWWYSVKAWAALILLFWCLIGIWIFASMMIRREVLEAIGGMDQSYFLYFEEVD